MRGSQRLSINNNNNADFLSITIEPWATEIQLKYGSTLDVLISYKYSGYPYFVISEDFIEIFLWKSCTFRLIVDNIEINDEGHQTPHP